LAVREVSRNGNTIMVDVAAPDGDKVSLFVEGPTPDWALPIPKRLKDAPPGLNRFAFELDGLPPGVTPQGQPLKLTLVGPDRAFEINVTLPDAPG
jgi:hypothetical protein